MMMAMVAPAFVFGLHFTRPGAVPERQMVSLVNLTPKLDFPMLQNVVGRDELVSELYSLTSQASGSPLLSL